MRKSSFWKNYRNKKKQKKYCHPSEKTWWNTTRHKAISIVVSFAGNEPRFLVVRDRRYRDWTFVTGGCRKKEISSPIHCAIRELKEETKGIVSPKKGQYSYFFFKTNAVDPRYTFLYHVYLFELDIPIETQQEHISSYQHQMICPTHPARTCYHETDNLLWVTFSELQSLQKWSIIRTHILDNPDFLSLISSFNRSNFNVAKFNNEKQSIYHRAD